VAGERRRVDADLLRPGQAGEQVAAPAAEIDDDIVRPRDALSLGQMALRANCWLRTARGQGAPLTRWAGQ
jgi:hypothetical protein